MLLANIKLVMGESGKTTFSILLGFLAALLLFCVILLFVRNILKRFGKILSLIHILARNLLRDVVGGYLGGRPESIDALEKMQSRLRASRRWPVYTRAKRSWSSCRCV